MPTLPHSRDHRRFRLATNDNETVVDDAPDTEGHRLATNDNETIVPELRRFESDDEDEEPAALGMRRIRQR